MNLQRMSPHPFDGSGNTFQVTCSRCGDVKSSADVLCDLDAPAGTYYCTGHCAAMVQAGLLVHPRHIDRQARLGHAANVAPCDVPCTYCGSAVNVICRKSGGAGMWGKTHAERQKLRFIVRAFVLGGI